MGKGDEVRCRRPSGACGICDYALRNLGFWPPLPDAPILPQNGHSVKNQRDGLDPYSVEIREAVVRIEDHW